MGKGTHERASRREQEENENPAAHMHPSRSSQPPTQPRRSERATTQLDTRASLGVPHYRAHDASVTSHVNAPSNAVAQSGLPSSSSSSVSSSHVQPASVSSVPAASGSAAVSSSSSRVSVVH